MKRLWFLIILFSFSAYTLGYCLETTTGAVKDSSIRTVSIDASSLEGVVPRILRPSAFASWNEESVREFLDDAGQKEIGIVRLFIEPELLGSKNEQDFIRRLRNDTATAHACKEIVNAGGIVVMQISGTPKWLRQQKDRNAYFWQGTPTDMDAWYRIVQETARHFKNDVGIAGSIWYEFSNEPDNSGDWSWHGTEEEFMQTYAKTVSAVKSIDARARVGAAGVLSYQGTFLNKKTPILQMLIKYCATHQVSLDFLTWHFFGVPTQINTQIIPTVKQWLRTNGLDENLPQVVTEYNPVVTYPSSYIPRPLAPNMKDSEVGAIATGKILYELYRGGVYGASLSLGDTGHMKRGDFQNGFGARTHKNLNHIKKPMYHVEMMYGSPYFEKNLVKSSVKTVHPYELDSPLYIVSSINDTKTKLSIVLGNYIEVPAAIAMKFLIVSKGYTMRDIKRWGGQEALTQYYEGRRALNTLTKVASQQADIIAGEPYYERYQELLTLTHPVKLDIANFDAPSYKVTRYVVDATHSNAYYHYWSNGNELDSAIKNQAFEMVESRVVPTLSALETLTCQPFSQTLLIIEKQ